MLSPRERENGYFLTYYMPGTEYTLSLSPHDTPSELLLGFQFSPGTERIGDQRLTVYRLAWIQS